MASDGALTSSWSLLCPSCHPVPPLAPSSPSFTSRRHSTLRGSKGHWFVCLTPVSTVACGSFCATFHAEHSPRFGLVPICQPTQALPKAGSSLRCSSTRLSMDLSLPCGGLLLLCSCSLRRRVLLLNFGADDLLLDPT